MVAWSQPARGADGEQVMELGEFTSRLHRNETATRAMMDALRVHAATLSRSICDDYKAVDAIVTRHEALIRQRWMKKTVAQRRNILLAAWPNMPEVHRPDNSVATERAKPGIIPDRFIWPFINQEDLTAPRTLLIFLNARGRKLPWVFAAIETQFSPVLLAVCNCSDEGFCSTTKIHFTEAVDPDSYGRVTEISTSSSKNCDTKDGYKICAKQSFQALLMQQRILGFLLACTRALLHDLTDNILFRGPVQEEPSVMQILEENDAEHSSFTDVLNLAPYRGWDSLNFSRLRDYIKGALSTQKDHIWVLREDPGYLADTIREYQDHSVYEILSACDSRPHHFASLPEYKTSILVDIMDESFAMLHAWNHLDTQLERYDRLLHEGATKQQQVLPILQIEKVARNAGRWLLERLYRCSCAAPGSRPYVFRKCSTGVFNYQYEYAYNTPVAKKEVLDLFEGFRWKGDSMLNWPVFLAFDLERVDRLLQTSATARKMITGRMMSLLTDLSIITECLRQILLWSSSPDVRTGRVDGCGCKVTISEETGLAFDKWNSALHQDFSPPLDLIYPLRGKLYYPEHKKRNRDTVAAMCKAEANLDHFWAAVDSHFEKKTGVAQYRVIQKCLEDSGEMHRTAPWANTPVSNKNSSKTTKHEFQSIPDQLHDKTVQITGAFDKMTVVEKIKAKTRGVPESTSDSTETSTMEPSDTPTKTVARVFTVDKRTLNVFRTLFSVPSEDIARLNSTHLMLFATSPMVRLGFSAEKLQGSAWQFTPATDVGTERGIHLHEPHPDSDINYVIAKRIGRRLGRVYGWCGDTFQLA